MMADIKNNIAKNITELRILNNMTQMELAEKLNYSDKTISKWERGDSSPDISVLVEIADMFGVTLDYLVRTENIEEAVIKHKTQQVTFNRRAVSYIAEGGGWRLDCSHLCFYYYNFNYKSNDIPMAVFCICFACCVDCKTDI